ncbi:MAG: GNAT family N-acetyltransferase, partial [Chloroflexi bacterium]|nr:GNAT family N-acetyltransferase [Chloroflexota bacterium]
MIAFRNFRAGDAGGVVTLTNECSAADQLDEPTSLAEFQEAMMAPNADFKRDLLVAVSQGHLVGFVNVWIEPTRRGILRLRVHPGFRNQGIGTALMGWALGHAGEMDLALIDAPIKAKLTGQQAFLGKLGFALERCWWVMRLNLSGELPLLLIPAGFNIRNFQDEGDVDALTAITNVAFAEHWGEREYAVDEERYWTSRPWFDPGLVWFVHEARSGQVAGYAWARIKQERIKLTGDRAGHIGELGVHPDFRRRGLGRALLLRAVNALKERGLAAAELEVDGGNPNAKRLYESLGFLQKEEFR